MKIKQTAIIALLTITAIVCMTSGSYAQDTQKENAVKAYYGGFVNKDWAAVSSQLAADFMFTSPADSGNYLSLQEFKQKCFPTCKYTKSVKFVKMFESGDELALQVQIMTTDNKIVRNVDIYNFNSAGKIKKIDVYFGPGIGYPGSNTK